MYEHEQYINSSTIIYITTRQGPIYILQSKLEHSEFFDYAFDTRK